MNSRYQEMFDEVRASDTLKQEVLRMQNQENGRRTRRRLPVAGLAAAVLAVVLVAGTALAVASPSLRDWFAREWAERTGGNISENQALLIDSLTQKVGESQAVGDVTVTVDSLTVGGDVLWALVDVEGLDFNADALYSFDQTDIEILPDPSGGAPGVMAYSIGSIGLTEDGAVRMLLEFSCNFRNNVQLERGGYTLHLSMQDLTLVRVKREDKIIYDGIWTFSIPLTVESFSTVITIDNVVLHDRTEPDIRHGENGEVEYDGVLEKDVTLTDIQLSSTGLSFLADSSVTLTVEAILSDGTEVLSSSGGGVTLEDGSMYCTNQWPVPLDVEDIVALRIGGTEIPVPQASE